MSPTSTTRCIPIASKVRTMTTLRSILGLVILSLLLVCIYKTRK
ncbi:hypothetical protein D6_00182 [Faustovirus]|nr:hypothetical protein D6_00182 [Faustovirus]